MRRIALSLVLVGLLGVVFAQNPDPKAADPKAADPKAAPAPMKAAEPKVYVDPDQPIPPRYEVILNIRTYKQTSPQDVLAAAIRAIENKRFDVLVAHLIDPTVTETKIAERARQLEPQVEVELMQVRAKQKADPNPTPRAERLPLEPVSFAAAVKEATKQRGFRAAVADLQVKFDNDPTAIAELKRYLRSGVFNGDDSQAKATIPELKGRAMFFKQVNGRWFIEDRQEDLPAAKPAAGM